MQTINTITNIKQWVKTIKAQGKTIALVPTMGGLHAGHLALVKRAKELADVVVVSIFVNPAQFSKNEDLATYPRNLAQDSELLANYSTDVIFIPDTKDIYPLDNGFKILAPSIANKWCGATRSQFFHGISLLVMKLFTLIQADFAIFGNKDYQQLHIIKKLVTDFLLNIKIIAIDTVRETDGLACSTRNEYLTTGARKIAPIFYKTLLNAKNMLLDNNDISSVKKYAINELKKYFIIEYFAIVDTNNLLECNNYDNIVIISAVVLDKIRLIDNIEVRCMFKIDDDAEQYIANLFDQQDNKGLALKIDVEKAGTPIATVGFNFCYPKDLSTNYNKFSYNGFDTYIDEVNIPYLKDSFVQLKIEGEQKKLTISAPNAKGEPPKEDAPLFDKIGYFIASEVSPQLASHGGFIELVEITKNNAVVLNFSGGCQGCSSVAATLKNGVETQLKAHFPEVSGVIDSTDHSYKENAYM